MMLGVAAGLRRGLRMDFSTFVTRNTPLEEMQFRGRRFLVKRDDRLRLLDSGVFGNKGRKLWWLNELDAARFPKSVASFGGPQSNAMVAIAAVANKQRIRSGSAGTASMSLSATGADDAPMAAPQFHYFTKRLPRWLRNYPSGNLARALALGITIHELSGDEYGRCFGDKAGAAATMPASLEDRVPGGTLWLPQGGAMVEAEAGLAILAQEIAEQWQARGEEGELVVLVPAGTGTTAYYLSKHLAPHGIEVAALCCIGREQYLADQLDALHRQVFPAKGQRLPLIMGGAENVPFGEPREELLAMWRELSDEAGLYVDLVYAPRAWQILFERLAAGDERLDGKTLLYLHTGGLEGVSTQLTRYKRAGFKGV